VTIIAPTKITPWIAFAPDIRGVCKMVETFETTSKPTKMLKINMVSRAISILIYLPLS
jgi:hypothetical protein